MNCLDTLNRLDDYFDGCLPPAEHVAIKSHAQACPACAAAMEREQNLRRRLRRLPAPEPDMALFSRTIAAAAAEAAERRRRRRWRTAGGALAATVVLALGLGLDVPVQGPAATEPTPSPVATVAAPIAVPIPPAITLALNEEREVSLALESQRRIEDATFTVVLPEGVELSGYPGLREISWIGSLESGSNLLVLPLRAQAGSGGELVARIDHIERHRSLTLRAEVIEPAVPAAPPAAEPVTVM